MNHDEILQLIESLRAGGDGDSTDAIERLAGALQTPGVDAKLLISLLEAPQTALRIAAVKGCGQRFSPELAAALKRVAGGSDREVKLALARGLKSLHRGAQGAVLSRLARDPDAEIRAEALRGLGDRTGSFQQLTRRLLQGDPSPVVRRTAAEVIDREDGAPDVLPALMFTLVGDADDSVRDRCAELIEQRLAREEALELSDLSLGPASLDDVHASIRRLGEDRFPRLLATLERRIKAVDLDELAKHGTDLTALAERGELERGLEMEGACEKLIELLIGEDPRSLVLLGKSGCGKTALIHELVYELRKPERGGWRVLRVGPTEFLVGTRYLGEWQTKLDALIEAVRRPRRVILYIPSISELHEVGTTVHSESNVASAMAPHIASDSVVVLGESTPDQYDQGLGQVPALNRLFERVLLQEASVERTRSIARAVRDRSGVDLPDAVLDQLVELSEYYLGRTARPGNALALLRGVLGGYSPELGPVTLRMVLEAVASSTGLPIDLLDDAVPLDLREVRRFFESRVMGQTEAIDTVVDAVTLIKAGLTDPNRPFGVFLFVGPTGVGKTELARALAEFIFGDVKRLLRLDMSEFASYEGFERLLGTGDGPGLLTETVRQNPFSVVLFDEIEKAHINVFDICLQIFDAGRLTDRRGNVVDFRRAILIMTSNVGSTAPSESPMGFGAPETPPAPIVDQDRTFRELTQCFRPEFLNRIDRIVNFRPLSLQVAESIARKEVQQILQRSGIARRELVIDIAPSVLSMLVREGYSTHFGARPLKRAVERLVLLPLGRLIASGRIRGKAVLRLLEREGRLEVDVSDAGQPVARPTSTPRIAPASERAYDELVERLAGLNERVEAFRSRKSGLVLRAQDSSLYEDARARTEVFDEIHDIEQFLELRDGFQRSLERVGQQLERTPHSRAERRFLDERLDELSAELAYLGFVANCRDAQDLGGALISVCLVDRSGNPIDAIEKLAVMYRGYSKRRRLSADVLAERFESSEACVFIQVSGLGAYGLLKAETGLHRFDRKVHDPSARGGREVIRKDSETARVDVAPFFVVVDRGFRSSLETRVRAPASREGRLIRRVALEVSLFHEPSLRSIRACLPGPRAQAIETLQRILLSQIEAPEPADASTRGRIVRQYEIGSAPKVKDLRTGRSTTSVDRVLGGQVDLLVADELRA